MIRRPVLLLIVALAALAIAAPAHGAEAGECELVPRYQCFGVESTDISLSTLQAGAHPDVSFDFDIKRDPETAPNVFGIKDGFASTRNVRFDFPPGLIGNPNIFGTPQQCKVEELLAFSCPNGSQVGVTTIYAYQLHATFVEPVYMMEPPGGDVVGRLGFVAGVYPIFSDIRVRSEGDYGLVADLSDTPPAVRLLRAETTIWGVPADPSHDNERCTPSEVFSFGCTTSPSRPPGSRKLPFWTNPTRCGAPLTFSTSASSWNEPERFDTKSVPLDTITGCNKLPFGPDLVFEPTSHAAGQPTGADITIRLPASDGVSVLEPSQMKDIRVKLPEGMAFNPGAADGLTTCSEAQVHFGERVNAECPDASKLAATEFDIPPLPRRMKGAVYLREPEPGNLFRIWIVADDLGAHVKLPGQLEVNKQTGQITSVTLDVPQTPVREVKLLFKSGLRAPLVNPPTCGEYRTEEEFAPWSGGPPLKSSVPMQINEGCANGGFSPKLSAGTTEPIGGRFSPFIFTLTREDGEQNPVALDVTLPQGLAASFIGIPRCEGADALNGTCPVASRIGKVRTAVGAGPFPLWVPQPGKRPTAVYLGGPYKGGPFSIVAVVPAQAGPFDLGDEVVRSALFVNPKTAQGTVKSDPLPQIVQGIPIRYRTIQVELDRPNFTLNPTGCEPKTVESTITSTEGAQAHPSAPFQAANCALLDFKPSLSLKLNGGVKRAAHPALHAVLRPRPGDANISTAAVRLPRSAFLDQGHIRTICTRVQFASDTCPAGSIYGHVTAKTPLLEETLQGPVYLRSSNHNLPDLVFALHGIVDVEATGRVDSVNGGIRTSFEEIPDVPITEVVVDLEGGKKGLIQNSKNLCAQANRARVSFGAHNGKASTLHPVLQNSCKKGAKAKRRHRRR